MTIGLVENNKYYVSYLLSYALINKHLSKLIFLKEFISNELNENSNFLSYNYTDSNLTLIQFLLITAG